MSILRLTTITLSLTVLVACGGGGGGGGTPTANLEKLPVFAVASAENTVSLVGGEQTASMTSAQIYQNIKSRAESADVLQISNISMVTDSNAASTPTIPVTCNFGFDCTFSFAEGFPLTQFSLDDVGSYPLFGNTNLPRFNVDSQVVMNHNGVTMVQGRGAAVQVVVRTESETRLEYHSYGGWLTGSVFGAESIAVTHESEDTPVFWYGSYSFGKNSGISPPPGSATWMGAMVGTTQRGEVIHGSALITIENSGRRRRVADRINVEFNNVRNLDNGTMVADMRWDNLPLRDEGAFDDESSQAGSISGNFYGENQAEVGGVFERNDIIGAFGARRPDGS